MVECLTTVLQWYRIYGHSTAATIKLQICSRPTPPFRNPFFAMILFEGKLAPGPPLPVQLGHGTVPCLWRRQSRLARLVVRAGWRRSTTSLSLSFSLYTTSTKGEGGESGQRAPPGHPAPDSSRGRSGTSNRIKLDTRAQMLKS